MKRRTLVLAITLALAFSLVLVTSFALGQGGISGTPPPYKVAAEATIHAKEIERAKLPTAPPGSFPTERRYLLAPPSSCPDPNLKSMIYDYKPMGPVYERGIVNVAVVPRNDMAYVVMAGSPMIDTPTGPIRDKQHGLIVVRQQFVDPCAVHPPERKLVPEYYYITASGTLTISRIEGDTALLNVAGGGTERFNFVTGQFAQMKPLTVTPIPLATRPPYPRP